MALVAAALAAGAGAFPKPPRIIEPANPSAAERLPEGDRRRVLIAGGGLAGLSAALELAERGFDVTIREAEGYVGGRAHARPVKIDVPHGEEPFMVEHGFHAWFHNYWTFKDIRQRLGVDRHFRKWGAVHYVFKDYKPESLISKGPYPLNMLGIIARSPNLHLTDAIKSSLMLPDVMYFDYDKVYDEYDNITFIEWGRQKKVAKPFFDIVFSPTLSVTLNEREVMSAAEMLMYQQLYFLSDPSADEREVATEDYHTAVFGPWVQHLTELGVNISLNDPVGSLALSLKDGVVDETGTHWDDVIVATDMKGVQRIMNSTQAEDAQNGLDELRAAVNNIPIAPPYKVVRVWFDKQLVEACSTAAGCPDIMETPDFSPVNLIAQYHLLERQSAEWANKTGGSIIEFHCYTWTLGDLPDREVWEAILPTVTEVYPEIGQQGWKALAVHVNSYQNFPSFKIGTNHRRPDSDFAERAGVPNLFFAGDWLRPAFPAALMERAVSTGRQAANLVLLKHGVRQVPLKVTSSHGPGILASTEELVV